MSIFTLLKVRQNLTLNNELWGYSKLNNCWPCLGKSGHTNRKDAVSIPTSLYYNITQNLILNIHVVKEILNSETPSNCFESLAFRFKTQNQKSLPDIKFHRVMTRTILWKIILSVSHNKTAFEIRLGSRQMPRLLPRHISIL